MFFRKINCTAVNGDTLYSIAEKFSTTVEKIALENQLRSPEIKIGQQLQITTTTPNMYR